MRRSLMLAASLAAGAVLGGCTFEHGVLVDHEDMITTGADGRAHEIVGHVHAETWTPAFLYVFPLLPSRSPERAQEVAIEHAKSMGADGVTDVRMHVETHMPFFWVAGWTENHVSATAVRFR